MLGGVISNQGLYLREITKYPLLGAEEERELARRSKRNDQSAREQLITSNLRLVVLFARRYVQRAHELDDLIQEGNMALIQAVDKYNPDIEPPVRFSSYASVAIKHRIGNFSLRHGYIGAVSRDLLSVRGDLYRVINSIKNIEGGIPTPEMVLERLREMKESEYKRYSVWRIKSLIQLFEYYDRFFDPNTNQENDGHGFVSGYGERARNDYEIIDNMEIEEIVLRELDKLDERTRDVIRRNFGLKRKKRVTLQEIGSDLKLTKERARQIKKRGLKQLRDFVFKNEGLDFQSAPSSFVRTLR